MFAWAVVGADPRIATISALAASSSAMISVSECVVDLLGELDQAAPHLAERPQVLLARLLLTDSTSWLAMAAVMHR